MKQPLKLVVSSQCVTAVSLAFDHQEEGCFSPLPFVSQPGFCFRFPHQTLSLALCRWRPLVCLTRLWLQDLCLQHVIIVPTLSPELLSQRLIDCPLICLLRPRLFILCFMSCSSSFHSFFTFTVLQYFFSLPLSIPPCLSTTLILIFSQCLCVIS